MTVASHSRAVVARPRHLENLPHLARQVAAEGRETIEVRSPLDLELVGEVPRSTPADVARAAERARVLQEDWRQRSFEERGKIFLKFHDRLLERQDEILDLIQLESGKARLHAYEEVADTAIVARFYAVHAARFLAPAPRKGAVPGLTQTWEYRHPKGLVGVVAPWNYPLSMGVTDAIPALLAGNGVVAKPDSQTPFSTLWALDLLHECGLPEGLWGIVCGAGSKLGPALFDAVDFVQFTGSTATGRHVAREAGGRLIGCSLELGGKNPMLVLADADLGLAVAGAVRGSFASAGQLCVSTERVYVLESLHERFLREFAAATRALRLGVRLDWSYDVGSLASAEQLARIEAHVADAVAKGATVEAGGRRRPEIGPFVYEPTVLSGVTPEMELHSEETFGPVVSVYPVASNHEAIERANDSPYGLNASVWSRDTELARRMATRLQAGTVTINETYVAGWASTEAPMGGFKDSGLGRRHGSEGILKYTEGQNVTVQRGLPIAPPKGVPAEAFARWFTGALKAVKRVPGIR
ncbi:MAG: succinate-semialdehyde dehydrogenase (NADP(+)) [Acidobacteria bacterium]|nr:succinate-semialdehyde dehydrogenase (NADP(+)) [Acidobacteriota bacterium]MCB9378645.1 succinate-semialdehyde dehydrogenase (NADP(+)) [Holophagales bacterium]